MAIPKRVYVVVSNRRHPAYVSVRKNRAADVAKRIWRPATVETYELVRKKPKKERR